MELIKIDRLVDMKVTCRPTGIANEDYTQYWRDEVTTSSSGHKASCSILYSLESSNLSIRCSGQYRIAVVQTTVDKSLNKGLQNIPCQRSLDYAQLT